MSQKPPGFLACLLPVTLFACGNALATVVGADPVTAGAVGKFFEALGPGLVQDFFQKRAAARRDAHDFAINGTLARAFSRAVANQMRSVADAADTANDQPAAKLLRQSANGFEEYWTAQLHKGSPEGLKDVDGQALANAFSEAIARDGALRLQPHVWEFVLKGAGLGNTWGAWHRDLGEHWPQVLLGRLTGRELPQGFLHELTFDEKASHKMTLRLLASLSVAARSPEVRAGLSEGDAAKLDRALSGIDQQLSAIQTRLDTLEGMVDAVHGEVKGARDDIRQLASEEIQKRAEELRREEKQRQAGCDISRILKYAPAELIGREAELKLLNDAWDKAVQDEPHRPRVLTFVALGGEGKTSLVAKWAASLADDNWPGCAAVFAWSFYSQGTREQAAVSSDLFLAEALTFFGDAAMAGSAAGAFDKGRRLARLVGERRALLILDGLEPLQYATTSPTPGELKDQGLAALLKGLAATSHGLCVVTTRYALPDLRAFLGQTVREEKLTRLARAAGVLLLKAHGVTGSDRPNLPHTDDAGRKEMLSEFEALVEDVDGHALTLHLMGSFLKRAFQGDIRRRDRVTFAKASQKTDNDHAFRAMAAYEKWLADGSEEARRELALLSLMGLFDRPATADCLRALLQVPAVAGLTEPLVGLPEEDWNGSLTALQDARLLTVNPQTVSLPNSPFPLPASLDAHPLLREYFAMRLRAPTGSQAPTGRNIPAQGNALGSDANKPASPEGAAHGANVSPLQGLGNSGAAVPRALPQAGMARPVGAQTSAEAWPAAHRRLYDHLCATTKDQPDATLEDLQPLYQAVAHGCQAGLQQEACAKVYRDRIQRGGKPTARRNSARSVPIWEPSPASSRFRGTAFRPHSRTPPKPGC